MKVAGMVETNALRIWSHIRTTQVPRFHLRFRGLAFTHVCAVGDLADSRPPGTFKCASGPPSCLFLRITVRRAHTSPRSRVEINCGGPVVSTARGAYLNKRH